MRAPFYPLQSKTLESTGVFRRFCLETPANWRVCLVGQIGKFYTYREGRNAAALALFDAIKKQLDPQNIMNPGVLK
jgi:hypothetical protein